MKLGRVFSSPWPKSGDLATCGAITCTLADTPALAEAAQAFATKHATPNPGEQAHRLISKVLGMVEEEQTQVEVQKAAAN